MVFDHQGEHDSQWAAITSIASKFSASQRRHCASGSASDDGVKPGLTKGERERPQALERGEPRTTQVQRDLDVRDGFLRGCARSPTEQMTAYIDRHKGRYGVEPIC
jgi:hypothetical protein